MPTLASAPPESLPAEHAKLPPVGEAPRFTRQGSDQLEQHLARTCDHVRAGVQSIIPGHKLEAVMLGGGYGRGEGGVLETEAGDRPYNDLEFYVCVRGNRFLNRWRYERGLHQLAERLSPVAGVEVEFKIISLDDLQRSPTTMFHYDLVMGHCWLLGTEELLEGCEHHREARNIPLSEATRLLMNRCTGLLFAGERLEHKLVTAEDADFAGRNLAKAQLAFGDALLASFGLYHWSCLERHERLRRLTLWEPLPWLSAVRRHHAAGVRFKLHPYRASASLTVLQGQHEELRTLGLSLWLWLENRRLDRSFQSAREYALCPVNKFPETNPWRNLLMNVRAFGPAALFARRPMRHPQERLLNALALLLWEPWRSDSRLFLRLRRDLRASRTAFPDLARTYQALWARTN